MLKTTKLHRIKNMVIFYRITIHLFCNAIHGQQKKIYREKNLNYSLFRLRKVFDESVAR